MYFFKQYFQLGCFLDPKYNVFIKEEELTLPWSFANSDPCPHFSTFIRLALD